VIGYPSASTPPRASKYRRNAFSTVIPVSGSVPPSAPVAGFGLGFDRLDLKALARLVLEIDVEAGVELVSTDDLGGGPVGLHGPDQAEIVLSVLQEVLREDAVTGGTRVSRELLVLFVDDLGASANLDAFRPIGLYSPVGVVLLRLAYRAAIATALTLHALEISHVPPFRCPVSSKTGLGLFFWPARRGVPAKVIRS
jgi:hypothetical protein